MFYNKHIKMIITTEHLTKYFQTVFQFVMWTKVLFWTYHKPTCGLIEQDVLL